MAASGAPGIGRTLARLAALTPRRGEPGSDPAQSRQQILALIQQSADPVSVEFLSERTGLHANTIRGHLDVLLAAGQVHREQGEARGRGRPPWLYSWGPEQRGLVDELKLALTTEFGGVVSPELVQDAAARWAEAIDPGLPATTPDEAVTRAAQALTNVGFSAEVSPLGDTIALRTCPYLDLVAEQPIICEIHSALLSQLLAGSGQDVSVAEMQVFPRPGQCLARLDRPDLKPVRTIKREAPRGDSPEPEMRRPR